MTRAKRKQICLVLATGLLASFAQAAPSILAPPATPGSAALPYVKSQAPVIVLRHVRIIDGTGAPAQEDRTVILSEGQIAAVGGADLAAPDNAEIHDLGGHSVLPGLVGMHDHMFYVASPNADAHGHSEPPQVVPQMTFSAPRLYLAAGVTTLRTTGSVETYADLNLKAMIDAGEFPGPHLDVTGPYLEGPRSSFIQMRRLKDVTDARRMVEFWADEGVTSFKAYTNITRAQLKAAIDAAHKRGLKVTGHLCSVTYPEAAALGIDNLEHGFFFNTQNDPGKAPDTCSPGGGMPTLLGMDPAGPEAASLIKLLVERKVAITSTLPVFEQFVPGHAPLDPNAMTVLTPQAREAYLYSRNQVSGAPREFLDTITKAFKTTMALERRFALAGGLLTAGPDPTGNGGIIPGFGNHRAMELLVEAGFSPVEAIKVGTLNGAIYLGLADHIGSIAPGKHADLLVVKGDPSKTIADIRNVAIVFKDGIAYDAGKLLESVRGRYGQY
ncbi:MAG: amidohydrolase family protein [Steroidobacteraceae bacterium]